MQTLEEMMRASMKRIANGGRIGPRDAGRAAGVISKRFYRWPKYQADQRGSAEDAVKENAERSNAEAIGRRVMKEINADA